MAAKLKTKRTSITTMGAKTQAFDIFQTPLSSHYPLPLNRQSQTKKISFLHKSGRKGWLRYAKQMSLEKL
jgi:hypothetical protein